ncbi:MAG: NAD(P)/FAD-dependent oxidoreductase [Pseudomonadota bacterium]
MTVKIGRRAVLAGLTAIGASPLMAQSIPTNPDVVVIGAGSAGLAAGRVLQQAGVSFVIVESSDRVGGRAYTETGRLGQPIDVGCSWVNGANNNPYAKLGYEKGFTMVDHSNADSDLFDMDGNPATGSDWVAYDKAWGAILEAMADAGRSGKDVSAASVIPDVPWGASVRSWMGAMDYGVTLDQVSTKSYWNSADSQPSYFVKEGLGTLVATLAEGMPISLNTPVTAIDYSGDGVTVETASGTIRAKACLVTVSVGVLAAEKIKFTPALPVEKQEAINDIPMGLLMKVPLMFDGARFDLGENNWVTYQLPENKAGEGCFFVSWPCGWDYMMGFIGGQFAWDLYGEGQDAVVDYAMDELVKFAGSDAKKRFKGGYASDWADNPNVLGAYGAVRPGKYGARAKLGAPINEKLFFGGEATGGAISALVHGAYMSGRFNAQQIVAALG